MKKGYVRISNALIQDVLNFPDGWVIEEVRPSLNRNGLEIHGESTMLISGQDFPETNNRNNAEEVALIFHKETIRVEVKRINIDHEKAE